MKRPIRVEGPIAYVPLPCGAEAIIDAEDAELVGKHNWYLDANNYVVTWLPLGNGERRLLRLHRLVMGAPEGKLVDHREGVKTDNRKCLLRPATHAQNQGNKGIPNHNTSGIKGVHWSEARKKWRARIVHEGKSIHLGYFTNVEEAAKAYREAALKYHGEFANFG
jgi:AP2 domain